MKISEEKTREIIELVRRYFPDFKTVDNEYFVKTEIGYKREAIRKANELLGESELNRLISGNEYNEIISRIEKVGKSTNLLWLSVPMAGDLKILYQENLDKESFCSEFKDLLYGEDPSFKRIEKYCDYVKSQDLPNNWVFPTYFLFLIHPETEVFVKPKVIKWMLEFLGMSGVYTKYPASSSYSALQSIWAELRDKLAGYDLKDMVDVQSVLYVAQAKALESVKTDISPDKTDKVKRLFKEFSDSYLNAEIGRKHAEMYKMSREEGINNIEEILKAKDKGTDITDLVLLKILPYSDSEGNREQGAWISVAPAITGNIKAWFESKKWAKSEDWPRIAQAILKFVVNAKDDPSQLKELCEEFSSLGFVKGFQTGMLTPILNALNPEEFLIINNKSRQVINYLLDGSFRQNLQDYPAINNASIQVINQFIQAIPEFKNELVDEKTTYDMFCHWLVAVKKYDFGKTRYWKIAPGENAWNWDAGREGGFIAIGWDEIGDLSGVTKKEFEERWKKIQESHPDWTKAGSNQVWRFLKLEEGDHIVANRGTTEVLGLGVVTGDYYFVPGEKHGHRIPVEWYDQNKRMVKQDGWRRTIIQLSEDEFKAVSELGIKESGKIFTDKSFELLKELHEKPTQEFYRTRVDEFKRHVEKPIQIVMKKVAESLPQPMLDNMETENKIFSRIPKNDWGKGGAWDFYWGAFYPKGGKRTEDAQLFVWINRDKIRFGFYIGEYGSNQRDRFSENCRKNSAALISVLDNFLPKDLVFYGAADKKSSEKAAADIKTMDWIKDPAKYGIHAAIELNRNECLRYSEEELVESVAETFRGLYPLVILAISNEPMSTIQEFIDMEDVPEPNPEYPLSICSEETGFEGEELERWIRAINRKGQIILYGPPGTGKTYIAEKLARHLVGGGDGFMEIVQFHPAYAYEDFIQGIRPKSRPDGGLEYPVVEGRFMEFCRRARGVEGICVLIIDEINRANLSRVFGELMYLLEYREEKMPLASGGEFRIPKNIRIIGTMNTADRSIALVDHALRRRFAFIPLYPNYEAMKRFHEKTDFDPEGLIQVLKNLNTQIGDPHYQVGITFFLRDDVEDQIADIWRMEIEPFLEEYFFDQRKKVEDFRWEQIRKEIIPEID